MEIHCKTLQEQHIEPAFEIAAKVFCSSSTIHRTLAVELNEYKNYLRPSFSDIAREGLSVCAIETVSNKILGCLMVTDFMKYIYSFNNKSSNSLAPIVAITENLCRKYTKKQRLHIGEFAFVDMGAVDQNFCGRGIYQAMRKYAHDLVKLNGFSYIVGELSSLETQYVILRKFQHKKVAEIVFKDFVFDGTKPFIKIKNPRSIILSEGKVT